MKTNYLVSLLVILILLSVSAAGCTVTTTTSSPSPSPAATKVTAPQTNSGTKSTSVVLYNVTIIRGRTATVLASLKSNGELFNGKTITWYIDSMPSRDVPVINGDSILRLSEAETGQLSLGTHKLTAEFKGDNNYLRSRTTVILTVSPPSDITAPVSISITRDYSAQLNDIYSSGEYVLLSPFHKMTRNGKEAYEGTVSQTGQVTLMYVYPMSQYGAAKTFREQLISNYKALGYTTYSATTESDWYGTLGTAVVSVSSVENSKLGVPLTMEYITSVG